MEGKEQATSLAAERSECNETQVDEAHQSRSETENEPMQNKKDQQTRSQIESNQ